MDVLVVEDSPEFRQVVETVAREAGHRVHAVGTLQEAETALGSFRPELVVLDLSLPDGDGLGLCRTIRETSNAYVLMLTGRDDEIDKVIGFKMGADDYVTKPFSPRELGARIEALSRRPRTGVHDGERRLGDLVIRPLSRSVEVAGVPVELTRIEFDLLDLLASNPTHVLTRAQMLEAVWGGNWYGDDHVVNVHMANLRKKLAAVSDQPIVRTVRGVGYGMAV